MISLAPFTVNDFDGLIGWINSLEELVQFAGPSFKYPLTHEQLHEYLLRDKLHPFKILLQHQDFDQIIGHCEINLSTKYPRLSRIIIGDPAMRGKGYGEMVVRLMVEKINQMTNTEIIDLNVFSFNKAGIRCYEKVGFNIIEEHTDTLNFEGLAWTRFNMQYVNHKKV